MNNQNYLLTLLRRAPQADSTISEVMRRLNLTVRPDPDELEKDISSWLASQALPSTYFDPTKAEAYVSERLTESLLPPSRVRLQVLEVSDRAMIEFLQEAENLPVTGDFIDYARTTGATHVDYTRVGKVIAQLGRDQNWSKMVAVAKSPLFNHYYMNDVYHWLSRAHLNGLITTEFFKTSLPASFRDLVLFQVLITSNFALFEHLVKSSAVSLQSAVKATSMFIGTLQKRADPNRFAQLKRVVAAVLTKSSKTVAAVDLFLDLSQMIPQCDADAAILMKLMKSVQAKFVFTIESKHCYRIASTINVTFLKCLHEMKLLELNYDFYNSAIWAGNLIPLKEFPFMSNGKYHIDDPRSSTLLARLSPYERKIIGY